MKRKNKILGLAISMFIALIGVYSIYNYYKIKADGIEVIGVSIKETKAKGLYGYSKTWETMYIVDSKPYFIDIVDEKGTPGNCYVLKYDRYVPYKSTYVRKAKSNQYENQIIFYGDGYPDSTFTIDYKSDSENKSLIFSESFAFQVDQSTKCMICIKRGNSIQKEFVFDISKQSSTYKRIELEYTKEEIGKNIQIKSDGSATVQNYSLRKGNVRAVLNADSNYLRIKGDRETKISKYLE